MQENSKQDIENKETATEPMDVKSTEAAQTAEKGAKTEKTDNKKKIKKLEEDLAAANAKAEETNEKYVRMLAEYDNFRKRTAKEREGIYADAYADALTAILPVIDNLERAAGCDDAEGLKKGLELTLKGFVETLEKMGVHEIEAIGKPFDPNLHNAVMHVEDDGYGENEIVEVLMKGYQKGDKVIRYSMVKVAN